MEYMHVQCESGHRLKAGMHLRGRTVSCPTCRAPVTIPQSNDALSDTGVMRILGDLAPLPAPPTPIRVQSRRCPRCGVDVLKSLSICNHCHCFIGTAPDYLKQLD